MTLGGHLSQPLFTELSTARDDDVVVNLARLLAPVGLVPVGDGLEHAAARGEGAQPRVAVVELLLQERNSSPSTLLNETGSRRRGTIAAAVPRGIREILREGALNAVRGDDSIL